MKHVLYFLFFPTIVDLESWNPRSSVYSELFLFHIALLCPRRVCVGSSCPWNADLSKGRRSGVTSVQKLQLTLYVDLQVNSSSLPVHTAEVSKPNSFENRKLENRSGHVNQWRNLNLLGLLHFTCTSAWSLYNTLCCHTTQPSRRQGQVLSRACSLGMRGTQEPDRKPRLLPRRPVQVPWATRASRHGQAQRIGAVARACQALPHEQCDV